MEEQRSGDSELDGLQSLRQPPEWKARIVEEVGPRLRKMSKAKVHPDELERFVQDVIVGLLRVLT